MPTEYLSRTPPISRRQLLRYLGAVSGGWLLSACTAPPEPTPTATIIATPATPSVTPTTMPTPRATASPSDTATPPVTLTPLATVAITPTATTPRIFLPIQSGDVASYPVAVPTQARPATPLSPPSPTPRPCLTPVAPPPELAPPFVGLHASADPHISHAERCTFLDLRPSLIKVLSFHPPEDIGLLAQSQPDAHWIVRVFLEFGGRNITPAQFVEFTLSDTVRTLDVLAGRDVIIELHNEPNLTAEGWQTTWQDGAQFAEWWLEVYAGYKKALPTARIIYPGLSPGASVTGIRRDHWQFMEASRSAVEAADGLGVHLYWSDIFPLLSALAVLDEMIGRFPAKPIWITEASYNTGGISDAERAKQYLNLISALQLRPTVQGVTFFVASASDPQFEPETWVGKSIAKQLGER